MGFFGKRKSEVELVKELQQLKEKRLKEEGYARLAEARQQELSKLRQAKQKQHAGSTINLGGMFQKGKVLLREQSARSSSGLDAMFGVPQRKKGAKKDDPFGGLF